MKSVTTISMEDVIFKAFQKQAQDICDQEIENAKQRIEERLREVTAHIVLRVSEFYSVERYGNQLRIEVKNLTPD